MIIIPTIKWPVMGM